MPNESKIKCAGTLGTNNSNAEAWFVKDPLFAVSSVGNHRINLPADVYLYAYMPIYMYLHVHI